MSLADDNLEIDAETLRELRDSGGDIQLVDIRDDSEREICSLSGTIDIPMQRLPNELDRLSPDTPVVVLCHHGMRSMQAAAWLRQQGFAGAVSVRGGIDAWAQQIDPTLALY